jgi:hypothetical protein
VASVVGMGVGNFVDLAFAAFVFAAFATLTSVGSCVFDDFGAHACAKLNRIVARIQITRVVLIFIVPVKVKGWREG